MSRNEAIAILNATIARLPDHKVEALAEMARSLADPAPLAPMLGEADLAAIERARQDFREGRAYAPDEARAYLDEAARRRRASAGAK